MACDVTSSPLGGAPKRSDLDSIAEFERIISREDGDESNGNQGIDPQLTISNASSPASNYSASTFNANAVDVTFSTEPSFDGYPDLNNQGSASPYFNSCNLPPINPSPLRNQLRRSVSEPPDGIPRVQHVLQPPQMTFHRDGHFLGDKIDASTGPMKAIPKNKQYRSQPYARKDQLRYQFRRAQTQPVRPPTSVPVMPPPRDRLITFEPSLPLQHPHMEPQPQYVNSQVCTPRPYPEVVASPLQWMDPELGAHSPASAQAHLVNAKAVSIQMTIDELRVMLFEEVQRAVKGLGSTKYEAVDEGAQTIAIPEEFYNTIETETPSGRQ